MTNRPKYSTDQFLHLRLRIPQWGSVRNFYTTWYSVCVFARNCRTASCSGQKDVVFLTVTESVHYDGSLQLLRKRRFRLTVVDSSKNMNLNRRFSDSFALYNGI